MSRFSDRETEQVYLTGFQKNIPEHVSRLAHERLRLLLAAASLQDVRVLGKILRWRNSPGVFGVGVDEKWHITFMWEDGIGAHTIALERRKSALEHSELTDDKNKTAADSSAAN
jgi:plasmid maintenance system killer protein